MDRKSVTRPQSQTIFDQDHYARLIEARGATIKQVVTDLRSKLWLSTALDAGCGLGFFAELLRECGLDVTAFDARFENVEEAQRRYPNIRFEIGDIQERSVLSLGTFDLVLCFGLLYHLESTLLSIRNLRGLTGKVLLLESMCFPDEEPWMLLREEQPIADQSITNLAFYATEGCLAKMLYRAGFRAVYRVAALPDHDDFRETPQHIRRRTVLLAGHDAIPVTGLTLLQEPKDAADPWAISNGASNLGHRAKVFLARPTKEKVQRIQVRARALVARTPAAIKLPFGATWMPEHSALDGMLVQGTFERAEMRFVERMLKPGMTVLDIGAHHGFYTLLASKQVGPGGKVFAFEPSPRERKRLERHVRLNKCGNVQVEATAVGGEGGNLAFFLVEGAEDYCNSLRPPAVKSATTKIVVAVTTLDNFLIRNGIPKVDFVKLDVEGAELDVLKGSKRLLTGTARPVWLVEVYDIRTSPWGYAAMEIVGYLGGIGYQWYRLHEGGSMVAIDADLDSYDMNLVAVPLERIQEVSDLVAEQGV
jgi:FkbM family methyltransferase